MVFDFPMLKKFYAGYASKVAEARNVLQRPLTLAEKVLYAHLSPASAVQTYVRGTDYAMFRPDRVAMQDATAQMALLQFMNAGREETAVPTTVHCDHLVCASDGEEADLMSAQRENAEVYDFLRSVSARYGIGFWRAGSGIIHQVVLENYAYPGGMMVGTDSHTPNAGGLGMVAVGVGGADAVDVMAGMDWELKFPKLIGVRLTGSLQGWASPKDVILKLAGLLTVKGATNAVIEYFGDGTASLSSTGKATICNMGAEVGATCSLFPYDGEMARYLQATGRAAVQELADGVAAELRPDEEVLAHPENFYDRLIEIDLSTLEPYVNGPFTPDAATPVGDMAEKVKNMGYPERVEVALVGSCTNSSYEDLTRAADVARQALQAGLRPRAQLVVNPGSAQIRATAERDGLLETLRAAGATLMANACGPCIGQWRRKTDDPQRRNSIVTTFNRNFAKRADGNPNTHAFIVSPEMAVALAFAGDLAFDPRSADLAAPNGGKFRFIPPTGHRLPPAGFAPCSAGYEAPQPGAPMPVVRPDSERLQLLKPFPTWDGADFTGMHLLIKTQGKCTTDHISMAGPWLRYRGHLEHISENLLMGAVNAFNGKTNSVRNALNGQYEAVSAVARAYKEQGSGSIVVAEDNYGEGSSREHAAMEPRFLGVKAIVAKSFARIHETNLKKQGVLALTFADAADYDRVREDDVVDVCGLQTLAPGSALTLVLHHADGSDEQLKAVHSYNEQQIEWFRAGSALGAMARRAATTKTGKN